MSKSGFEPPAREVPIEVSPALFEQAMSWPERFRSKVTISNGCWEWNASKAKAGYGRYGRGGRIAGAENAHRMALILSGIEIPKGMHVDHLCRNRGCVRPDHLEIVRPHVNTRRGRQSNVAGVCRAGLHAWTPENIMMEGSTMRCRPCRDARESQYRPAQGTHHRDKTHCPQGHPYAGANLHITRKGSRNCRECHRTQARIAYRRKAGLSV